MNQLGRYKILLVEDDRFSADLAEQWLESAGFLVTVKHSGGEARALLESGTEFDLLILDLGLPVVDGMELLSNVRASGSTVGVIVLTGRSSEPDRIAGLRQGADDYIVKPFSPGELLARAEAVLRRTSKGRSRAMTFGDVTVDLNARSVHVKNQEVILTRTEFDLLAELVKHHDKVRSRAALLSAVWNSRPSPSGYALLNEYISRLRKKCSLTQISTVRGVGYRFDSTGLHGD